MRVLHVTNAYPSEENQVKGIFIKEQIDSLRDKGIIVDVLVVDGKGALRKYIKTLYCIWVKGRSYEIVHAHHVFCGIICIFGGVRDRLVVSFLNDVGCNIIGVPSALSARVERWVQLQSNTAIFKSPRFQGYLRSQDRIIPNGVRGGVVPTADGVARARFSLSVEALEVAPLFISANDLHRRSKRYDRFSEVVETLRGWGFAVKPLIMVDVPRDEVQTYLYAANVLVVVSDFEGSPNAVKEALSAGLPVVSTDVGDVRHLINNVPGCEIVEPYDPVAFAKAVLFAARSDISRECVARAFEYCRPTIERAASDICGIYERLSGHV